MNKAITAEIVTEANTVLTDEVSARLCLEAVDCASISEIAARCGVPYQMLRKWIQLGLEGDPRYSRFAVDFEKARSVHENRWMGNVEAVAADTNPRAANARLNANQFLLKKHFPKQYGDQLFVSTMIEHQADGFKLDALDATQLREFQKMLKALKAYNEGADEEEVKRLVSKIKVGT